MNLSEIREIMPTRKIVDLLKVVNLGSIDYSQLNNYFSNDSKVLSTLSDTLSLLNALNMLSFENNKIIAVSKISSNLSRDELNQQIMTELLNKKIIIPLKFEEEIHILLKNELYGIRNYLLFERLIESTLIRSRYKLSQHESKVVEKIKSKGISPESFEKILLAKKNNGLRAEYLAMEYEKQRLGGLKEILHVSLDDVSLGYDILSYSNKNKEFPDMCIEVKSISSEKSKFFLSRNEIEVAEYYRDTYYLYLVNILNGEVTIIKNPYEKIFISEITKTIESISYNLMDLNDLNEKDH